MPTKKVSLRIFLLVVFCINFIFYPIRDALSDQEKSIPKAIPITEPEDENIPDAPRALPVQPPQKDDGLEVPKAIPLDEKDISDKPNDLRKMSSMYMFNPFVGLFRFLLRSHSNSRCFFSR